MVKRPTVNVKEWRGGGKRSGLEFGKLVKVKEGERKGEVGKKRPFGRRW